MAEFYASAEVERVLKILNLDEVDHDLAFKFARSATRRTGTSRGAWAA